MTDGGMVWKKKILRIQVLAKCRSFSPEERQILSDAIWAQVRNLACYKQAKRIFCFASMENEVQTLDFIQNSLKEGKEVSLPLVMNRGVMEAVRVRGLSDLAPGDFGILTAKIGRRVLIPPETIDCAIVPGVAFSRGGARLGYGGGYYDRFLNEKAPQACRIAATFACQIMEDIPVEAHDVRMHRIVTEKEAILCG